jgi:hypothetical protein
MAVIQTLERPSLLHRCGLPDGSFQTRTSVL